MANVYGTDVKALDDLPDPEELCSGDEAAAYSIARRHSTPVDAPVEYGEDADYQCFDVEEYLDDVLDDTTADQIENLSRQVTQDDPFVSSSSTDVTQNGSGTIALSVDAHGADGPFPLVISVDKLGVQILRGS